MDHVPVWARVGVPVGTESTTNEVIKLASLDWLVDIGDLYLHTPKKIQSTTVETESGSKYPFPGRALERLLCTYRTDTGQPLWGIITPKYHPIQNHEAFAVFDEITKDGKAAFSYAGELDGGRLVFIALKLSAVFQIENDIVQQYILGVLGHDGSTSLTILFCPVRLLCSNQLRMVIATAKDKIVIKHTKNYKTRLKQAAEIIGSANLYFEEMKRELYALKKVVWTDDNMRDLAAILFLDKAELTVYVNTPKMTKSATSTKKYNLLRRFMYYYKHGVAQEEAFPGTSYHALNAITGYGEHGKQYRAGNDNKFEQVMYGAYHKDFVMKSIPYLKDPEQLKVTLNKYKNQDGKLIEQPKSI